MTRSALQCLPGANVGLVRKYVDKKGQKRIVGLSEKLRQSQWLVCNLQYVCVCVLDLWMHAIASFCVLRIFTYLQHHGTASGPILQTLEGALRDWPRRVLRCTVGDCVHDLACQHDDIAWDLYGQVTLYLLNDFASFHKSHILKMVEFDSPPFVCAGAFATTSGGDAGRHHMWGCWIVPSVFLPQWDPWPTVSWWSMVRCPLAKIRWCVQLVCEQMDVENASGNSSQFWSHCNIC